MQSTDHVCTLRESRNFQCFLAWKRWLLRRYPPCYQYSKKTEGNWLRGEDRGWWRQRGNMAALQVAWQARCNNINNIKAAKLGERPTILDSHSDKVLKDFTDQRRDEKIDKKVPIFRCTTPSTGKRLGEVVVGTLYCWWCCTPKYRNFFAHLSSRFWSVKSFKTLRLTKPWHGSGRIVTGDSWFASVKTAVQLRNHVLYFLGPVKTAHRKYPIEALKRSCAAEHGGQVTATWTDDKVDLLAIGWQDRSVHTFA